jgi:hypothetical protein
MLVQLSKEVLENLETNLSIQRKGATPAENSKATAIELLSRASGLEASIAYLKLPYTYEVTTSDKKKIDSRRMMGTMSAEVIEIMRDELIEAGIQAWNEYKKLSAEG